jgi:hypothetical protein
VQPPKGGSSAAAGAHVARKAAKKADILGDITPSFGGDRAAEAVAGVPDRRLGAVGLEAVAGHDLPREPLRSSLVQHGVEHGHDVTGAVD